MHGRRKVPQGWCIKRLDELAKFNPEQIGDSTSPDTVIDYIDLSAVEETGGCPKRSRLFFRDAPSRARRKVSYGDILASTVRPYLRGFTRVLEDADDTMTVASTGYSVIRPIEPLDGEFIYQHILSGEFVTWLLPLMTGSGYPAVSDGDMAAYPLLCPPPSERQRIGDVLATVDSAIDQTRAVIEQTLRVKTALLQNLLTRGLPGRHRKFRTYKYIGRIPASWGVEPIGNVFHIQLGKMLSPKSKTGMAYRPYLGNSNVQWGRFDLKKIEEMDFSEEEVRKFTLQPGDILVCEGGEVGRTAIWKGRIQGCCYQKAIHRLRAIRANSIVPEFFMYFMQYGTTNNTFLPFTGESAIAHLTRETLLGVPTPLPSYEEQQAMVDVLETVESRIGTEEETYKSLQQMKAALSQALLTGRIRVKADE